MDEDSALESPAAIALGKGHLPIKLRRLKHVAGGSGASGNAAAKGTHGGPLEILVPQLLVPVFAFWENVRRMVRTGGEVFRGITGPSSKD